MKKVSLVVVLTWLSLTASAALEFVGEPAEWAVIGGEYEYQPIVSNTGTEPVSFTALQIPSWLSFEGTQLTGTPLEGSEGLNDLVVLRAENGDGEQADQSFRIVIGRLIGPVDNPPQGGSSTWVTGMPKVARSGGDALLITGVQAAAAYPVYIGFKENGVAMKMNFSGPNGSNGQDFTVPEGFVFSPSEILTWLEISPSNLDGGIGVWRGQTNLPSSVGGGTVPIFLRAEVRDIFNNSALKLTDKSRLGLGPTVGGVARIPDSGDLRIGYNLHAIATFPAGTPALDYFNNIQFKQPTDRTITQFNYGFYWVNTPPRFTQNSGLQVNQDGSVVLTTEMINAADTEHGSSDIRFVLGDGETPSGAPQFGTLEVLVAEVWTPLNGGDSFTLAEVEAGKVRYVQNGSYQTSDGFNFQIADAENAVARDGDFTVFQSGITIGLVNHPPVPVDQAIELGIGATVEGILGFSDPDDGFLSQTYTVSMDTLSTLGTFTITDETTGAFSFVSDGSIGMETISWTISDGELSVSASVTLTIQNQTPGIEPLVLTGANIESIVGQLIINDPDLPAQTMTVELVGLPVKGTVQINGDTVRYTPLEGRFGEDAFTIKAIDSEGAESSVQTVNVITHPYTIGAEALYFGGSLPLEGGGSEGVIQRVNPLNGDFTTLTEGLGRQVQGLVYSSKYKTLIAAVRVSESESPMNALVKIDPISGDWSMDGVFSVDDLLSVPLGLATDGDDHIMVANGPGGIIRVSLIDGTQSQVNLGLPEGSFIVDVQPLGEDLLWVSDVQNVGNAADGSLYLGSRSNGSVTTPINLSPAGDPAAIYYDGVSSLFIARSGIPVEEIQLNPISYQSLPESPVAPWILANGLTPFGDDWILFDPFAGVIYKQEMASGIITTLNIEGLASPSTVLTVYGVSEIVVLNASGAPLVSGEVFDFGVLQANQSPLVYTITILNEGTDDLTFGTVSLSGEDASLFSFSTTLEGSLKVGQSAELTLNFHSSISGDYFANLVIPTNDPIYPEFELNLIAEVNTAPVLSSYNVTTYLDTSISINQQAILAKVSDLEGHLVLLETADSLSAQGGSVVVESGVLIYNPAIGFSGSDSFSISIKDEKGGTSTVPITVEVLGESPPQSNLDGVGSVGFASGDQATLSFQGSVGDRFKIQRSLNLTTWEEIGIGIPSPNGFFILLDDPSLFGRAFYRTVKEE